MPDLNDVREAYSDAGLEILAINILEQPGKVRDAARHLGTKYPVLLDENGWVTRADSVRATPTYIFIDRDGVYRDLVVGSPRAGVLEAKIAPLLSPPAGEP